MTKLAIVDKNDLIISGLKHILNNEDDFNVVCTTNDYKRINDLNIKFKPELILISVDTNIEYIELAVKYLLEDNNEIKLIAMTDSLQDENLMKTLQCGFHGYIRKSDNKDSLIHAIKEVITGNSFIHPKATTQFLTEYFKLNDRVKNIENLNHYTNEYTEQELTYRETRMLKLISQGFSDKAIAETLFLSEKTIRNNVNKMIRKLGVKHRTQAAVVGIKYGWIDLE